MIKKEKQICVCGLDAGTIELVKISLQTLGMHVSDGQELQDGTYVIVVGAIKGTGSACLEQMDALMKEMERIRKSNPESVVYLSDSRVYGKSFGPQTSRKEEELGYVCHTSMEEMDRQCMRMAEHFVCRMAKEEQLPVKIVRLEEKPERKEMDARMPWILKVLHNGISGEIYNVTEHMDRSAERNNRSEGRKAKANPLSWKETRSPLTAMEIEMNTEKVRNYAASELFE